MDLRARLRRYFVSGFFVVVPFGLSAFVIWWMVAAADSALAPLLVAAFGAHVPGLGILTALAAILLAGMLASHVVGVHLIELAEEALLRVPGFKSVYGTVRQMTDAFSPQNKNAFKSVVLVEYPRPGVYSLGFVTGETVAALPGADRELLAVFIPTNHVYIGDVVLVPREHVHPTRMSVQQGIQAALAAGAILPKRL